MPRRGLLNKSFNDLKSKILLFGCLIIFVFLFLAFLKSFFITSRLDNEMNSRPSIVRKEVVLVLDFGESGTVRKFRTEIAPPKKIRAWGLLQQAAAFSGMELEIENGFKLVKIDGIPGEIRNNESWQLYLNSQKQENGPFNILVMGGDEVLFKLE